MTYYLEHSEALDALRRLPSEIFDSICTDPPAGISFMGKEWDSDGGDPLQWTLGLAEILREALRVLKPGAYGVVWALPRTSHWTALALYLAGFEIRDVVMHLYGKGFPKSLDASKAVDKHLGVTRNIVGYRQLTGNAAVSTKDKGGTYGVGVGTAPAKTVPITEATSIEAKAVEGLGTALKPGGEHWILVRKPLAGTVAENLLEHGVGAMNIDACRIPTDWQEPDRPESWKRSGHSAQPDALKIAAPAGQGIDCHPGGRWPANVVFSHTEDCADACVEDCPVRMLDEQAGERRSGARKAGVRKGLGYNGANGDGGPALPGSKGGASRFFNTFHPGDDPWTDNASNATTPLPDVRHPSASVAAVAPQNGPQSNAVISEWSMSPALSVVRPSELSRGIIDNYALGNAPANPSVLNAPVAQSAENLSAKCVTNSAPSPAPWSHDPSQGSIHGQDFIQGPKKPTQNPDHARAAGVQEGTDTTMTTPNQKLSNGYASNAIEENTISANHAGQEYEKLPQSSTRFRYQTKASTKERELGCEALPLRSAHDCVDREEGSAGMQSPRAGAGRTGAGRRNHHPTVKSIELMRWLLRLVTPPRGAAVDPFMGSGSTGCAAVLEGFMFYGVERDAEYLEIAKARIEHYVKRG